MALLLFLLIPSGFIMAYLAYWHFRTRRIRRVTRRFQVEGDEANRRRRGLSCGMGWRMGLSAASGVVLCTFVFGLSWLLGVVVGGLAPLFLVSEWEEFQRRRYEDGVRQAVDIGVGVFESGGTVEMWVQSCAANLETTPLTAVFAQGAAQISERTLPVESWLTSVSDTTPSRYLQYVIAGVLSNTDNGGDMLQFFGEAAAELQVRERYGRVMRTQRKNSLTLMLTLFAFPLALYFMFRHPMARLFAVEPWTNWLFAALFAGYMGILALAKRLAAPNGGM